ncbi:NACHT, LRR and PYD domains-containing protein 1a-like [Trichomycterus rosablanca]|uniref:NACHT, LRR and PYD domains-containing protein 1a-like n=1 Tax=Trichomycterus rosablanca TaxID=2290929 RepID=UPI002F35C74F
MFSPEVGDAYRFCCRHAGLFQCEITNLVFEMEGKGEVLYKMVSWDNSFLEGLCQMQPAGPLYSIDCFEGSISRLHLPHCQILGTGQNQTGLAVAHVTGSNLEIIQPREVTNTHVVIDVQDLSLFGVIINLIFSASPITAQILLFCEEMPDIEINKLNMHLLPGNVPVEEVQKRHQGIRYITASSKCHLTPGKKYRPSCEPHEFQPEVEIFHPTFEVLIKDKVKNIRLGLLEEDGLMVWRPRWVFLTGYSSKEATTTVNTAGAEFVEKHRENLIQKVTSVMEILDRLLSKNMISEETYEEIKANKTSQHQMRKLYTFLNSGTIKEEFYRVLREKEPFLLDDLESGPSRA